MTADITKDDKNLIIKIPLKQNVYDYLGDEKIGEMPNIAGLITKDEHGNDECGFVHLVDRHYKGKDPDVSDFFFEFWGEIEAFKELCKKLELGIYYL